MASPQLEKARMPTPGLSLDTSVMAAQGSTGRTSPSITSSPNSLTANEKDAVVSTEIVRNHSNISTPYSSTNPFDTDIEAIVSSSSTNCGRKSQLLPDAPDNQVWPCQAHWKQKAKEAKKKRSCTCLAHLSKRNRTIVKILIVLLVVGIAVGVGFGISKPLGAGVWHDNN